MTHDNFFAYGTFIIYAVFAHIKYWDFWGQRGQKQDFGGQWNHHYKNIYGWVDYCMDNGNNYLFAENDCTKGKKKSKLFLWGILNTVTNENGYASDCHMVLWKMK